MDIGTANVKGPVKYPCKHGCSARFLTIGTAMRKHERECDANPANAKEILPGETKIERDMNRYIRHMSLLQITIQSDMDGMTPDNPAFDVYYQFLKDTNKLVGGFIHTQSLVQDGMV